MSNSKARVINTVSNDTYCFPPEKAMSGTVSFSPASKVVTGVGTKFLSELSSSTGGSQPVLRFTHFVVKALNEIKEIAFIISDTQLVLKNAPVFTAVGEAYQATGDKCDRKVISVIRPNPPFGAQMVQYWDGGDQVFSEAFELKDPNGLDPFLILADGSADSTISYVLSSI